MAKRAWWILGLLLLSFGGIMLWLVNSASNNGEEMAEASFGTAILTAEPLATISPAPSQAAYAITDAEALEFMNTISNGSPLAIKEALARITAEQDRRFIPVLIDAYRGLQLRLLRVVDVQPILETLETLSGQTFGEDWPAWVEWYGNTDLEPPPGFTGWKGRMLAQIDPGFGQFLQDGLPSRLRPEEIQWGGVVVDGIPALDNPPMLGAEEATYLNSQDAVFGLALNGEARAYPLRILDWHEMANDVVGGVPISLAYCTLCGAAIAYDGRASDSNTYTFGSSGFLYRSNKLMYDRQTRTLWNQLTGEPVLGELAGTEVTLNLLPVVLTTWQDWQQRHPNTLVVDVETGFPRNYTAGAAYGDYFAAAETMFPVAQRSSLLPAKAQIYALRVADIPKAYPLDALAEAVVVNDRVGETAVVLIAPNGVVMVEGDSQRAGAVRYQAGGEVRAYLRGSETFAPGEMDNEVVDGNGRSWQVTEEALVSPDGQTLDRVSGHLAYWFGWFAFFPDTLVYGLEGG